MLQTMKSLNRLGIFLLAFLSAIAAINEIYSANGVSLALVLSVIVFIGSLVWLLKYDNVIE